MILKLIDHTHKRQQNINFIQIEFKLLLDLFNFSKKNIRLKILNIGGLIKK